MPTSSSTVEQPPVLGARAQSLATIVYGQNGRIVICDLHRLECRVRPVALQNTRTLANFETFLRSPDIVFAEITPAACQRASEIRAQYRFAPMDSLHLAIAIEHGCDRFVTNDVHLAACGDIAIEILP